MEKKLILVDDEDIFLEILKASLEDEGFQVFTAKNGIKAIDIINKEKINIIFTDLNMPGLDGIDLCKEIKKTNPKAWVCATTGNASLFAQAETKDIYFDDYLPKPFNLDLVIKTANKIFNKILSERIYFSAD